MSQVMSRIAALVVTTGVSAGLLVAHTTSKAATVAAGGGERVLLSQKLANIPGQSLTAVVVSYPPGGKSPQHHHAGSVFAFVVSGEIRSMNSATGPARVYRAGESFFEPAGSVHLVSENASVTQPAKLLAVFVAAADSRLTTPEQP
jgi:quercetin dioxygenase-like cupin family protein